MKVGDLVRKVNHHNVENLQNLVGLVLEVDHTTRQAGILPVKVMWTDNYGTFWNIAKNLEVLGENR